MTTLSTPSLTLKQRELHETIASDYKIILTIHGQRSGSGFGNATAIMDRAIRHPGSHHAIIRSTTMAAKRHVWELLLKGERGILTLYAEANNMSVSDLCEVSDSAMTVTLRNGSTISVMGADDKKAMERLMGRDFVTIFLRDVTQFASANLVRRCQTRLSQHIEYEDEEGYPETLQPKLLMDCNPPAEDHWVGLLALFADPRKVAIFQMSTWDNARHIPTNYIDEMRHGLTIYDFERLIEGRFRPQSETTISVEPSNKEGGQT